jgi:formate hydrogenlyase subunit 6/NADH:ubiquinone oxidoreductase subunit I
MKGANNTYFGNIKEGIKTSLKGLSLSWRHLLQARQSRKPIFVDNPDYFSQQTGIVTLQYPHQHLPLPDHGRYQLHNEMDDCIVCDKCAKVCPVDCIEIEPIKATGIAGYASDGSAIRLYAAKFDIDMSKCMFCGLCTTVCPTECLTMTSEYDFSTFDIKTHNFEFGNLTPEQSQEKRELYEQFVAEKETLKQSAVSNLQSAVGGETVEETPKPKPAFKPSFKPKVFDNQEVTEDKTIEEVTVREQLAINNEQFVDKTPKPKPVFKPSFKPKSVENKEVIEDKVGEEAILETPKPKVVFKPSFKSKPIENQEVVKNTEKVVVETPKAKPVFKPSFKPKVAETQVEPTRTTEISFRESDKVGEEMAEAPKPKPVFKPSFKKSVENKEVVEEKVGEEVVAEIPKPKPVFKPTFKPKPKAEDTNN